MFVEVLPNFVWVIRGNWTKGSAFGFLYGGIEAFLEIYSKNLTVKGEGVNFFLEGVNLGLLLSLGSSWWASAGRLGSVGWVSVDWLGIVSWVSAGLFGSKD